MTEVEGYPGPDRARPADRDAADGPAAPPAARRRGGDASASRPCARPSTCNPFRVSGEPQADGKTVRLWASGPRGLADHGRHRRPALIHEHRRQRMQPLKGITVVTLEHAIAAPFATRQLADLGARVIKIERPGVGRLRPRLRRARARPGVALRLDQPLQGKPHARRQAPRGGQAMLERLVLEQGRRRGAEPRARRRGAPGPGLRRRCRRRSPAIIVCDISGYGDDGPVPRQEGLRPADPERGRASCRSPARPTSPCKAGPSIADIAAGMYAYTSILAALLQRGQTGQRPAHRHLDAGVAGRVDELSAVLRLRRRRAAAAHRRRARDDLSLRPVPRRRRRAP